jgi:hypothetical protein
MRFELKFHHCLHSDSRARFVVAFFPPTVVGRIAVERLTYSLIFLIASLLIIIQSVVSV